MIVTCPQCASRYRVREEKLPAGGGNIQCPACGRIFPAFPPGSTARGPEAEPTTAMELPSFQATAPAAPAPASVTPVRSADAEEATAVVSRRPLARGEETPTSPRAMPPDQWKIRSPVGLVYDFPDLTALQTWLSTRDSVDGMSASRDGGVTWQLLSLFPELRSALPKAALTRLTASAQGTTGAERTVLLQAPDRRAPSLPGTDRPSGSLPVAPPAPAPTVALALKPKADPSRPQVAEARMPPRPGGGPVLEPTQALRVPRDTVTAPAPIVTAKPPAAAPTAPAPTGARAAATAPARPSIRSGSHSGARPATGARGTRPPSASTATRRAATTAARPALSRQERPKPRKAGAATYLAIVLTLAVLAVVGLQVAGVYDFYGALGLRHATPEPAVATAPGPTPSPPAPATAAEPTAQPAANQPPAEPGDRALQLLAERRQGINPNASRVLALLTQARRAADDGRIEEAITLGQNALQFDRTNADVVCMLADWNRQIGAFDQADAYADQCSRLREGAEARTEGGVTEP